MYRQLCILSIGLLLCGPVLASTEKCKYKVTNCVVNDPNKGYVSVTSFNGSDSAYLIESRIKHVEEKGGHLAMACGESQCDTRISVKWNGKRKTLWHYDACEDLWISGGPKKLDQIKLVNTRACDDK